MESSLRGRGRGSGTGGSSTTGREARQLLGTIHGDLFTRPNNQDKRGKSGTVENCLVNFVPIETKADFLIYQYHVDFSPFVDSKSFRQKMLLDPRIVHEIGRYFVFDGMILYMTHEWDNQQTIEAPHPVTGERIGVKFKQTSRFGLNDAQTINCFNIVIRRCFDEIGFTQLGRNYFDPTAGQAVEQIGLDILPGYETAIRMYESQLMLCVENRFKMVRTHSMLDLLRKEGQRRGNQPEVIAEKFNEMFAGTTVITLYNNKLHRFSRLDTTLSPLSKFSKDGRETTLKDYFEDQYSKKVTDLSQPIIVCEGKPKQPGEEPQKAYLLPEFTNPTGLTDEMRKDMKIMRAISAYTRLSPEIRRRNTQQLINKLNSNPSVVNHLNAWNIQIGKTLAQMEARLLPSELLTCGHARSITGSNAEWSKNVRNAGVFSGKPLKNWIVVGPTGGSYGDLCMKFVEEIGRQSREIGIEYAAPMCEVAASNQPQSYVAAIQAALQKVSNFEVHMVVVMLTDDNKTRYDSVKKYLCTKTEVPSQCVNLKTLAGKAPDSGQNKNFGSIVLKILLQMVCKMGGSLWKVKIPLKKAMIVGYDLYHDSTLKGKTVGACVSTIDADYTQFYSQTRPHENPTQLGTNLSHFIRKALRKYYDNNDQQLPERIILYRDGAGDGQIPLLHDGTVTNPNPGTVVDTVVTRPERYDFYMVPQYVQQGTVTPVSYNIIHDDTGLSPDHHHRLAFKLCHLYYNWQGTVRVPAPCQYAHKMAFLVAQSIHEEAKEGHRNKLYFL